MRRRSAGMSRSRYVRMKSNRHSKLLAYVGRQQALRGSRPGARDLRNPESPVARSLGGCISLNAMRPAMRLARLPQTGRWKRTGGRESDRPAEAPSAAVQIWLTLSGCEKAWHPVAISDADGERGPRGAHSDCSTSDAASHGHAACSRSRSAAPQLPASIPMRGPSCPRCSGPPGRQRARA